MKPQPNMPLKKTGALNEKLLTGRKSFINLRRFNVLLFFMK
jgi:hypothetical protein